MKYYWNIDKDGAWTKAGKTRQLKVYVRSVRIKTVYSFWCFLTSYSIDDPTSTWRLLATKCDFAWFSVWTPAPGLVGWWSWLCWAERSPVLWGSDLGQGWALQSPVITRTSPTPHTSHLTPYNSYLIPHTSHLIVTSSSSTRLCSVKWGRCSGAERGDYLSFLMLIVNRDRIWSRSGQGRMIWIRNYHYILLCSYEPFSE